MKVGTSFDLIFFKTYVSEIYFCSSHRVDHNGENKI
jgi:hypothetical protein